MSGCEHCVGPLWSKVHLCLLISSDTAWPSGPSRPLCTTPLKLAPVQRWKIEFTVSDAPGKKLISPLSISCLRGISVFHFPQCPVKGCESASLWHCFDFPHCALFWLSFFPFQESGIVLTAFLHCSPLFWLDCKSLELFWQEGARWQKADAVKSYLKGPEMHILVMHIRL